MVLGMPGSSDPLDYRAGDGDRERAAERLRDAAGDGRITFDELDTRLTAAYQARTYGELAAVTADLPPPDELPAVSTGKPLRLVGSGGSVRRDGRWQVPAQVVIERKHGSVRLDFRDAVFSTEVVAVEVSMRHGSVTLILPDGATAAVDCTTQHASIRSKVPEVRSPGRPHLVVTGEHAHGSMRVRYGRGHRWRRNR